MWRRISIPATTNLGMSNAKGGSETGIKDTGRVHKVFGTYRSVDKTTYQFTFQFLCFSHWRYRYRCYLSTQ